MSRVIDICDLRLYILFIAAVFGFMNQSYDMKEGESYNNVTVGLLLGELGREVVVVLDTLSATAEGNGITTL